MFLGGRQTPPRSVLSQIVTQSRLGFPIIYQMIPVFSTHMFLCLLGGRQTPPRSVLSQIDSSSNHASDSSPSNRGNGGDHGNRDAPQHAPDVKVVTVGERLDAAIDALVSSHIQPDSSRQPQGLPIGLYYYYLLLLLLLFLLISYKVITVGERLSFRPISKQIHRDRHRDCLLVCIILIIKFWK